MGKGLGGYDGMSWPRLTIVLRAMRLPWSPRWLQSVVALTMIDLRRRGKVHRIGMCGTNGTKFPGIRAHMEGAIGSKYADMDLTLDTWPADGERDAKAYLEALDCYDPGDCCTVFTPDDTHFEIAMAAVERGMHCIVTKPVVKTLEEHRLLHESLERLG